MERFNKLDWTYQKEQIKDVVKRYNNASVVLDTTGLGDTVYDDLSNDGVLIEPFKFTNTTKNLLISNLMRTMDNALVQLPDDPDLIAEFEAFEFDVTELGNVRYGAPSGQHDDIVISVALCAWGLQNAVVNVIGRADNPEDQAETMYNEPAALSNYDDDEWEEMPRHGVNRVRLA